MDSSKFFTSDRRKDGASSSTNDPRTEFERDYDRILFSTPVRRLADKTQVFPLEKNDSVRTRLTHSHEVSNLARSIGINLASQGIFDDYLDKPTRNIPAILAAIGLVHDLGNPPFGHQGESAIQHWFSRNSKDEKTSIFKDSGLTQAQKDDFLKFEGNAQTFRLITRLQILNNDFGLDLTFGTLAAAIKYPVPVEKRIKKHPTKKKHGFFQSELNIVQTVWEKTGLKEGVRHPLTYIMEACDDIAYLILDAEDAIKKNLVSFNDLIADLESKNSDPIVAGVLKVAKEKHEKYKTFGLSPKELNDISTQRLRVEVIYNMVKSVTDSFITNKDKIFNGSFESNLVNESDSATLSEVLRNFDTLNAYRAPSVLELELNGFNVLNNIMDKLWIGITERDDLDNLKSDRKTPFAKFVYGLISENYRRIFENGSEDLPNRYKESQLLTDMVSGMTDNFALDFNEKLNKFYDERYS